ncbi:MAG: PepSY domain-containing protein, partial [Oscillospiraceae bacterium]|nr:PepSY domain-containing protein [Oscillospiraceae bacterium]
NHAGYTADGVRRLRAERDYDDGRFEYEVEFYVGNIEYSYEIDAASGTVLHYEAEQDD